MSEPKIAPATNNPAPGPPLWVAAVGLIGLAAALYWPVMGYEFVNWDDPWYVLKNPLIRSWHPSNLWRIATEMSVKNYAPLTTLSLLVDHTVFGLQPGGYHFVNVVLHAANSVFVYLLILQLTRRPGVALATAALFVVHPVQVESVAWVSSRKTLLCSFFMLTSALCWFRRERSGRAECWGTILLGLALLAKAAAIVMPPIVVAYDVIIARKRLADSLPRQLIPMFLCVLLLSVTMSAQNLYMGGVRSHMSLSKLHILAIDAVILWRYVGMLLAPVGLSLLYDPPTTGIVVPVVWSAFGWIIVASIGWRWRRSRPGVLFGLICWFCLLAPVLNLFPISTLMNDRYLYLPSLAVFTLSAIAFARFAEWAGFLKSSPDFDRVTGVSLGRCGILCLALVTIGGYSLITTQRLPVWRSDHALWERTAAQVPQLAVVQIQRADSLYARGHEAAAIATLRLALDRTRPDEADRQRILERLQRWTRDRKSRDVSFVSVDEGLQGPSHSSSNGH